LPAVTETVFGTPLIGRFNKVRSNTQIEIPLIVGDVLMVPHQFARVRIQRNCGVLTILPMINEVLNGDRLRQLLDPTHVIDVIVGRDQVIKSASSPQRGQPP